MLEIRSLLFVSFSFRWNCTIRLISNIYTNTRVSRYQDKWLSKRKNQKTNSTRSRRWWTVNIFEISGLYIYGHYFHMVAKVASMRHSYWILGPVFFALRFIYSMKIYMVANALRQDIFYVCLCVVFVLNSDQAKRMNVLRTLTTWIGAGRTCTAKKLMVFQSIFYMMLLV